ncbi:MAG: four helix bundle protein [Terriglobia bacterium]
MAGVEKVQSHRDLIVWQKAMDLVVESYRLTSRFPASETYRLVAQITRAAASATKRDYANFLSIARGSVTETETFLTLATRPDTSARAMPRTLSA